MHSTEDAAGTTPHATLKFAFIDALRGYAVLLVIASHVGSMFPELPYPVKKLTNFGWHGVQLFFLISCVTLLMSWRADERKGRSNAVTFWRRRFFRIAPMYYLAAAFYFIADPPPGGFDLWQAVRALTFVNGWHPLWTPTVLSQWTVVPGGWSIGVEFTFYAAFPLIATLIRSLPAALLFFVLSVALGCVANTLAYPDLAASYGAFSAGNFLYFWFPNQLPIFALGTVLYLTIEHMASKRTSPGATLIMRWRYSIIAVSVVAMYALTELHLPTRLWLDPPAPFPILIMVSIAFMMVTLVIALDPDNLLVNRAICALGKVSFSVYILHFFVVRKLPLLLPSLFDTHATGVPAILACFALGIVTVPLTFGLSRVTFRFIEAPMIRIGRRAPPHGAAITATRLPEPG